jgi:hypothetical protein
MGRRRRVAWCSGDLPAEAGRVPPLAPLWLRIFLAAPWARAFIVICPAGPGGPVLGFGREAWEAFAASVRTTAE